MSRNQQIYQSWMEIQDLIGEAKLWPKFIRELFWRKRLLHWDRIVLATFCYINGLDPVILTEWIGLLGLCRDQSGIRHIQALYRLFSHRNYRLYGYNVSHNRYEYIDGTIRHYTHRSERH